MNRVITSFFLIAMCLFSCKKEYQLVENEDSDYFPIELGQIRIYAVDSLFYDDFYEPVKIDSSYYQLKELVADTFRDNTGALTFRIERYKRYSDSTSWIINDIVTVNEFEQKIERVENNLRQINLIFPFNENITWKGNAYIHAGPNLDYLDGWDFAYYDLHKPDTINGYFFDSTALVVQQNDTSLIRKDYFIEKYAKNVGLYYKEASHLAKQNIGEPWQSGYYIRYELLNYTL